MSHLPVLPRLAVPSIALPRLGLPQVGATTVARFLALGITVVLAGLMLWSVGPANVVGHLMEASNRQASVFLNLLTGAVGLALAASAMALFRGRPGWSIGFAALPLLALFAMLVR